MPWPSFTPGCVLGPCTEGAATASAWRFRVQEAQRIRLVLAVPGELVFLGFKDICSEIFKAILKSGKSNSHSSNLPKVLKTLTLNSHYPTPK